MRANKSDAQRAQFFEKIEAPTEEMKDRAKNTIQSFAADEADAEMLLQATGLLDYEGFKRNRIRY